MNEQNQTNGVAFFGNNSVARRWAFCPWDGEKLEAGWAHCPKCGAAIGQQAAPLVPFPQPIPVYPDPIPVAYPPYITWITGPNPLAIMHLTTI